MIDQYLPHIFGALAGFAVMAIGVLVRRMYRSIDLIFTKIDRQTKEIHKLQMAICAVAPEKTHMFSAFMVDEQK